MNNNETHWIKPKISEELEFTKTTGNEIAIMKYGKEWPIVYMIFNDKEMYIGETVDAGTRMLQHYANPKRRQLKKVRFVYSNGFNKSSILDLESYLISHFSADGKFILQNDNAGQQKHNYWQQENYRAEFAGIWKSLQNLKLAKHSLTKIENDNLFKFSPYKNLTDDQFLIANHILSQLSTDIKNNKESTFIVNGGPGTGKTVLAIYLMKLLSTKTIDETGLDDKSLVRATKSIQQASPRLKIGIVVSMSNLRNTLKRVFKQFDDLGSKVVLGPGDVANYNGQFDILIVDESHRLKAPRNVGAEIGSIQKNNVKLGIDKKQGTQLDWIIKKSKHQIFFYDEYQSIKRADVDAKQFHELEKRGAHMLQLDAQIRCGKGGQRYVNYIRSIFSDKPPERFESFESKNESQNYDFKFFDNVHKMTEAIRKMNNDDGVELCRNVAGYAWEWKTKGKIAPQNLQETKACIDNGDYDIDIDGHKYIWNVRYDNWVNSPNSPNEIGCIHTIQGFDLNYAGVIIGNELKYDKEKDQLYIDKKQYFDKNGKNKTSDEDLKRYILNIYYILCTRGINGTYIYACDKNLREYLKKFVKSF